MKKTSNLAKASLGTQKGFSTLLGLLLFIVLAGGGLYLYSEKVSKEMPNINPVSTSTQDETENIVGGDKDEHGCIGSAGYSWCAVKNKCLRSWEEKCEATQSTSSDPIACTMDAKECPDGSYVGRTGPNCEFVCPTTSKGKIYVYVHKGPICPVQQFPIEPGCADRPFANAEVKIKIKDSGVLVDTFKTDINGGFNTDLSVGEYVLEVSPESNGILPMCELKEIIVKKGESVNLDISCDTGIR